ATARAGISWPSDRGRVVGGRLTPESGRAVLLDILPHPSPGGETRAGQPDRVPHLLDPAERHAARVPVVVERDDLLLEQAVEAVRVRRIGVLRLAAGLNCPTGEPVVALLPPPVQRPQLRHAIERRLHAARA